MTPRNRAHKNTWLETLCHDPRLEVIGPAAPTGRTFQYLKAAGKAGGKRSRHFNCFCKLHRHQLLPAKEGASASDVRLQTANPIGRNRRLQLIDHRLASSRMESKDLVILS